MQAKNDNSYELQDVHVEYIKLLLKGDTFKKQHDYINAIDCFVQASTMGDIFYPFKQIANIQHDLGLWEDALQMCERLILQNKADCSIYQLRSELRSKLNVDDQAVEVDAEQWRSTSTVGLYLHKSRECVKQCKYKQAIKILLQGMCNNPTEANYLQREIDAVMEKM